MRTLIINEQARNRSLVLGARPGNIGGAIAEKLAETDWYVYGDDCQVVTPARQRSMYSAPAGDRAPEGVPYASSDLCVITVGTTHMEPFSEVSASDMLKVLDGSLYLPLECARRYVQERVGVMAIDEAGQTGEHHSTIVFIGSYAYNHPFTHCTSYCTAKAGLNMAAQSLAWELAPEGFHVHIINPHHVRGTPMTDEVRKGMMKGAHKMSAAQAEEYSRKDLRMPNLLSAMDVADVVHLIAEGKLEWMAGQPINLYGSVR